MGTNKISDEVRRRRRKRSVRHHNRSFANLPALKHRAMREKEDLKKTAKSGDIRWIKAEARPVYIAVTCTKCQFSTAVGSWWGGLGKKEEIGGCVAK